jgi:guanyl-specific ribonuclease Sa
VKGIGQGFLNIVNALQDTVVGTANLPATGVNAIAAMEEAVGILPEGSVRAPYIPSPDWSRGALTEESDLGHGTSKFLGGAGVEALTGAFVAKLTGLSRWLKGADKLDEVADGAKAGQSAGFAKGGGEVAPRIPTKATDTLDQIRKTGQAPKGFKGGRAFKNDGRAGGQVLPQVDPKGSPITYKEFDVNPYQKGVNRGAERLVVGSDGRSYFTGDHYGTFTEILP